MRYSRSLGLKSELIHESDGHKIAKIQGSGAGSAFRYESGKHCIQRIPNTESKGRKQTSIVSVGILPLKKYEGDEKLQEKDLEETFQTGKQGAGGQNVNRIKSAVRLRYVPLNISVFINGRDQGQNRQEARNILTQRVNDIKRAKRDVEYASFRKTQMGDGNRGDKIRTYNLLNSRATDHRYGIKTHKVNDVLEKGMFALLHPRD
jgi:peptide chain release factor 1